MNGFHRADGELHVEQVPLSAIAAEHGTPCYVYSTAAITSAYQALTGAFEAEGGQADIRYAVKANSNIAVLALLSRLGAGFDIVSGGELHRVLRAGGDPAKVVFSGVGKQNWEMELALKEGIGCFNLESASELARLRGVAKQLGAVAPVSVRVNPDVDPQTHPYIATGLKETKFGVSAEEALAIYREASSDAAFKVVGIDCHIGSQITELEPFTIALDKLLELSDALQGEGIAIDHVDLGGGLGVRYRDENPISLETFAQAIMQRMADRSETIMLEPGRSLVADAGALLTQVMTLKQNHDRNIAVLDAAMNDLIRPALYQAWQGVVPVSDEARPSRLWELVGPICETGDFLAKDRELGIKEGDLLAVMSAGAYGFVMASNYNSRGRAPEVLVDGDAVHLVRTRETPDDQLRLEHLPPA